MLAFTSVVVAPWIQRRFGLHSSNLLARLFYHGLPDRLDKPDLASAAR
jgi:hypothetical protein